MPPFIRGGLKPGQLSYSYVANFEKEDAQIVISDTPKSSKLSGVAIAGIVVGGLTAAADATVGTTLFHKHRQANIVQEASVLEEALIQY